MPAGSAASRGPFTAAACALVLVLAVARAGAGQASSTCLPLEPTLPHGNLIVPGVMGGVIYAGAGGGRSSPLLMDIHVPPRAAGVPMAVVVHGGGWTTGSRIAHVGQLLERLTEAGFAWASVDYRLGGLAGWQESVADVQAALAFLRCHARALGIDPSRIVLIGEETGGQLAAHAAAATQPAGLVLIGAPYDLPVLQADGMEQAGAALRRAASLVESGRLRVAPAMPVYVIHGGADTEVPPSQADAFCAAVRHGGGRCTLDIVEGASHRFENWWPSQWGYKDRLIQWMRRVAGPAALRPRPFRPSKLRAPLAPGLHKRIVFDAEHGLTLDAWIPEGDGPHVPVIIVHGGGWEAGDRVTYVTPLFRPLADAGLAWFSIDYRLTPAVRHDAQLEDLRAAIAFVRREAARLRVDAGRLVLAGESASAQMVALAGVEDPSLAGVVSFYGVYDFEPFAGASPRSLPARLFGIRAPLSDADRATLRRYSPVHRATREQAPMLLVNGTAERLWEQGQAYAARLAAIGARHERHVVEGAPHGIENWEGHADREPYKRRVVEWIREVTGRPGR